MNQITWVTLYTYNSLKITSLSSTYKHYQCVMLFVHESDLAGETDFDSLKKGG